MPILSGIRPRPTARAASAERRAAPVRRLLRPQQPLINGDIGWVVDNVFATIVEGLDEMAASVGRDPSQNRTHRPPVQG
ncbi:MAG: DUF3830 family protein [Geodermatophilaceae bacterium]